jgi:DNA-binding SARP family transcriptional activator
LRTRRGEWLLALLALRRDQPVERVWLAGALWPESDHRQGADSLRRTLTDLRQALGQEAIRLLAPTAHTLALHLTEAEADVLAFDACVDRGDRESLEEAVSLYRGPLLEGCSEEWLLPARLAREQAYLAALETLAAQALAGGEAAAAERYLRRCVSTDPLRESAHRALMETLAARGSYGAALLVYRELRLLLHRELHVEPDPETRALFDRLKIDGQRPSQGRPRAGPSPTSALSSAPAPDAVPSPPRPDPLPVTPAARVVILSRENGGSDEALLEHLETQLAARGFQVSVDRHAALGLEGAREIESRLRAADAVVPLLSMESAASEMLAYEVQIAHEAAATASGARHGKPLLLPVRVDDTGPLPEPLAAILEPIPQVSWRGPHDDDRLVADLVRALAAPAVPRPVVAREKLEPVGGAVPLDSAFYVVRPIDAEVREAIARQDSLVLIKGARQMGKTSLLARGLHQARQAGARVVRTDFQTLNASHLESMEALVLKLADSIGYQLDLDTPPDEVWHPRAGPSENFKRYWQRVALRAIEGPIVWGLDEVDRLFGCEFSGELFGLFRSWHNERALDPEGPWDRLTLAIAYATEAHLFITDPYQSPFNVGTRLSLEDFTPVQVADLDQRYGSPLRGDDELAAYMHLLGGQPHLVRRGLHHMVTQEIDFAALEREADRDEGVFGDHLRRMLVSLARDPALCEVVRGVLQGRPCPHGENFYRLRSAGILTGETASDARLRCHLYATYLSRHLL